MAAFYPLPRCLFYGVGGFHWGRFTIVFMRPPVRSEIKKVVYWMSEILFAAEIAFRRLDGCVPQQKLNLLQFTTTVVTQLRARPGLLAHALAYSDCNFRLFQGVVPALNAGTVQSGPEITLVIHGKFKLGHWHGWHKRLESI